MKDRLKVAIIGAGVIGRVHAENLAFKIPTAQAVVIADINESACRQVAEQCRIPPGIYRLP